MGAQWLQIISTFYGTCLVSWQNPEEKMFFYLQVKVNQDVMFSARIFFLLDWWVMQLTSEFIELNKDNTTKPKFIVKTRKKKRNNYTLSFGIKKILTLLIWFTCIKIHHHHYSWYESLHKFTVRTRNSWGVEYNSMVIVWDLRGGNCMLLAHRP